jgi:tRNA pseudouridine38-40 synthase
MSTAPTSEPIESPTPVAGPAIEDPALRHWLVRVQFDGAAFAGYQVQDGVRTVAAELAAGWMQWQGEKVELRASSRTDAGVHARGLPVLVRTRRELPAKAIVLGWNAHLPDDLAIARAEPVGPEFHVRHDAVGKRYVYRMWNARARAPLLRTTHWHVPALLDLDAMRAAAAILQGDHDFAAFRAASCQSPTTVRSMRQIRLDVEQRGEDGVGGALALVVEGNAFLHNMVRILAGTVVSVGRGQRSLDDVRRALESGDRRDPGQTAPPHGLLLDEVFYGPHGARQGLDFKSLLTRMQATIPMERVRLP